MTRLLFYGDPHGEWRPLLRACAEHSPDAVFVVGDCDLDQPLQVVLRDVFAAGVPVHYVVGNHDTDSAAWWQNLVECHPDGNLHCRAVETGRVRVAGLGGVFRGRVWYPNVGGDADEPINWFSRAELVKATPRQSRYRGGLPLTHLSTIFAEDIEALRRLGEVDILVSHEGPFGTKGNRHGMAGINMAAAVCRAHLIVHGHHHHDYDEILPNGVRVRGLGLAEPWVLDIDEDL